MKTKLILRTITLLFLMVSLLIISSCSKKPNESLTDEQKAQQDKNKDSSSIDQKNLTESDEDLTTVDYKEFYDQLAPHGEWIQVKFEDVGMKSKTIISDNSSKNSSSLLNLFGVNNAYADPEVSAEMAFVWKPSDDLAVSLVVGETPEYRPYSNGQWVNTDAGWYFRAPNPYEETTSHYGRWVKTRGHGWLWVPGRVWAPAWVDWRQDDDYVSWAPMPPSDYFVEGVINVPIIEDDNFQIVLRSSFLEPDIYRYFDHHRDMSDMRRMDGIVIVNNTIINRGPDINVIQNIYGRHIDMINISHVRNFGDVRYSDKEYRVYSPGFNRYNHNGNEGNKMKEPKSFKNYNDWNSGKSDKANEVKKGNKSNDNGYKSKGNDNGNKNKGNVNSTKNKGNNTGNKTKGNNNSTKNKRNNTGNKTKGNDNSTKNKGNNTGNKTKGNDNGNKTKGNDNGSKNNGNNNGKNKK